MHPLMQISSDFISLVVATEVHVILFRNIHTYLKEDTSKTTKINTPPPKEKKEKKRLLTLQYSETSQNRPALGPKIMASLEGWPVL
jgi:hypothetical protein